MTSSYQTEIFFIKVVDNTSKLQALSEIVIKHFEKGDNLLITTPSAEAAHFVDQQIWRYPEESFIPHIVTNSFSKNKIVITTATKNINQATILLNLCPHAYEEPQNFRIIYEFFDLSHQSKHELSSKRQAFYQSKGLVLHTR